MIKSVDEILEGVKIKPKKEYDKFKTSSIYSAKGKYDSVISDLLKNVSFDTKLKGNYKNLKIKDNYEIIRPLLEREYMFQDKKPTVYKGTLMIN